MNEKTVALTPAQLEIAKEQLKAIEETKKATVKTKQAEYQVAKNACKPKVILATLHPEIKTLVEKATKTATDTKAKLISLGYSEKAIRSFGVTTLLDKHLGSSATEVAYKTKKQTALDAVATLKASF